MPILAVDTVVTAIRACPVSPQRLVVAIDGRSGSGKSTVAEAVAQASGAVIVPCDDFFAASVSNAEWDRRTPVQRAADAIDWRRLKREAIEPLRTGRAARWYAFDFLAGPRGDGTYPLQRTPTERAPNPVVLLDGAYSARPELADVLDLSVLVKNVCELRSRGIRAVEQDDRVRGTLGRGPLQGIGAVTARTSQKVEGIPTRCSPSPQWLDRFTFQAAPIYGICRALHWRATVPFRVAHASGKEIIARHDDSAAGLSDRFGHGALARTTASINGHD